MTSLTGNLFVDVGANIGGYSVRLSRKFKDVLAIEPNPIAADRLHTNLKLNGITNVSIFEGAISDREGEASLSVPSSNKTTRSSIVEKYRSDTRYNVRTETLDSILEGYSKIDLIKVDTEGAEVSVLKGATETLRKCSRFVIETEPPTESNVKDTLASYGFVFSDLDSKVGSRNILAEHVSG